MQLGKTSVQKERLLSGIAPLPIPPIRETWSSFFGRKTQHFARMTEFFFDDDNDGCSDNYDDSGGNFDDNDDKNIQLL